MPKSARFDLQLLLDLLRIEEDPDRWRDVLEPAAAHVDDLVLLGDFESAVPLAQAIATRTRAARAAPTVAPFAAAAVDRLAAGHLMQSMVGHLRTVDDDVARTGQGAVPRARAAAPSGRWPKRWPPKSADARSAG